MHALSTSRTALQLLIPRELVSPTERVGWAPLRIVAACLASATLETWLPYGIARPASLRRRSSAERFFDKNDRLTTRRLLAIYFVLLAVLLGLAFVPHLEGKWVWDDVFLVQNNQALVSPDGIHTIVTHDVVSGAGQQASDVYHPIPMIFLWILSHCGIHSVAAFRTVNVALHAGCVMLFAAWMRRREVPLIATAFAAALFAVHPLVTEPVMWITGSHDTIATLGSLLALWVWPTEGEKHSWPRIAVATIATLWAALSKEAYFALPIILFAQAAVLGSTKGLVVRCAKALLPFLSVALVVFIRHSLGINTSSDGTKAPIADLMIDYATIVFHYLELGLTFGDAPTTESFHQLSGGAVGVVFIVLAAVSGWVALQIRNGVPYARVSAIGWAWFLIALLPHTVATPVIGMYGNRYGYFPLMGLLACVVGAALPLAERVSHKGIRKWSWLAPFAALTIVPFAAAEATHWKDELTLFGADLERIPDDPRTLYHYGHAVRLEAGCQKALPFFARSIDRDASYGRGWHNVAGCLIDLQRYQEALVPAQMAYKLQPGDLGATYNLAVARLANNDEAGGRALLADILRKDPRHPGALRVLATLPPAKASSPD